MPASERARPGAVKASGSKTPELALGSQASSWLALAPQQLQVGS